MFEPMTDVEINTLIEELKELEVLPDRKFDTRVAHALGFITPYNEQMNKFGTLLGVEGFGNKQALFAPWWPSRVDHRKDFLYIANCLKIPNYTESLNAVLSLTCSTETATIVKQAIDSLSFYFETQNKPWPSTAESYSHWLAVYVVIEVLKLKVTKTTN